MQVGLLFGCAGTGHTSPSEEGNVSGIIQNPNRQNPNRSRSSTIKIGKKQKQRPRRSGFPERDADPWPFLLGSALEKNMPEALFIHGDRKIVLKLKEEIRQQIQADIQAAVETFGNLTPAYFDQIRELSIQHWLKMSRTEIFEETFLNKGEKK